MKRRVGIAQALLNDPEVLILDEPTGGLDPGERVRFRNLLSEFAHDRIVLISTHIVPDVEYIAACHAIIKDGKLLAAGTTAELVKLVEGKVWSSVISPHMLPEYERSLQIVSLRNEHDGSISIRYLAVYSIVTLAEMDIGRLQLFFAAAGLLSVLASVSFTLYLSSICKSATASLASALAFCIAPVVISMTVPGELSTWLCSILPASGTSIQASILYAVTDFRFLNLGGLAVWTPYAMLGANIIEIPLFSVLAVRAYCKHSIK